MRSGKSPASTEETGLTLLRNRSRETLYIPFVGREVAFMGTADKELQAPSAQTTSVALAISETTRLG